jgi:hypothetical protein
LSLEIHEKEKQHGALCDVLGGIDKIVKIDATPPASR